MNTQTSPGRNKRKLAIFGAAAILLVTLAWYLKNYVSLDQLAEQENQIRSAIAANPWRSFAIGFLIYTVVALVPGTGGKAIIYGWLFGFWQAMTIVTVGLTISAMAIFYLSRYLIQESIERRYTDFLAQMNKHLEKEGAFYLITLRLLHAPYSIVNPVCGASRIRTWTFFWTTLVGLLPANAIWVYVGVRLPTLRELASGGAETFIDLPLIGALIAIGILPLLFRWLVRQFGAPGTAKEIHDATHQDTKGESCDHRS
jgi:uncharacterized membrane protein YdjX (TVP38/TMEM64 family)